MPLHMRLPKLRGPNAKTAMAIGPFRTYMTPVNLSRLAMFAAGERSFRRTRCSKRASSRRQDERVKILATGELTLALTIKAHGFSAAAKAKIEAAGGTVEVLADAVLMRTIGR